ncbi:MAG: hypothetical protein EOM37_04005 [Proteobacteria bacterium]|jgi:hypothetical protein|nr:hypothetical protein [Alphaproteobacteria bacterium]NCC03199.1 hypothetical protein [Pseudomonadota bacterium]
MEQTAELPGQNDTEVPQNPYQDLTEVELAHYIALSKNELEALSVDAFKKAAQQVTSRDDAYLKSICDVRNGLFTIRHCVGQIADALQERIDATEQMDNGLVKSGRK